ncbi:MAG: Glycerol uptake facilitator or related permease [Verrucomicrobia bacterium]|jgi:aquaporin Z|nr:Glycerol uptake facilitator or related permease [Verrucomicrobiota bacterium]
MNKYLAEFFGVFFWMLTLGCVSINAGVGTIPAIGIGVMVAVMTMLMWHVSGAHLNPAVSVTMWRSGLLPGKELAPYIVFQFLGAGAAAAVIKVLKRTAVSGNLQSHPVAVFTAEFLFTLLLCYALLRLCRQREKLSPVASGMMIGAIITGGVFAMGTVSGALFNPATTLGSGMVGLLPFKSLILYWAAQVMAGFVAPYAYRGLNPDRK